ncbi:hypothetical protein PENSTE_c021G09515 [Penicillium steckii]|uniref:N-acetyltransferase domain-containing protein n=1 Tax=Penicillium steckii TaxID=303698 RepID=A0A1V6STD0_9EURO|nr:hypothetical protein PENSTE_c021G09515 [Penicillium steckii]
MNSEYTYSFFRVSKTDNINESARKYRDLRLRALQTSPGSFASTYETEAAFSEAEWIDRLTIPGFEVFICAATPLNEKANGQNPAEWIGQVTFRGPMTEAEFALPAESGQSEQKPETEEEFWQVLGLFTLPDHRGNGLGAKLCQEAFDYLRTWRSSPQQIHLRLMVKPENHITVNLYKRLGFSVIGKCTLVEALRAAGDGHLLPKDTSTAKYSERSGLIMAFYMSRA